MGKVGRMMMMMAPSSSSGCGGKSFGSTAAFVMGSSSSRSSNYNNKLSNTLRWRRSSSSASIATATTTLLSSSSSTLADDSLFDQQGNVNPATTATLVATNQNQKQQHQLERVPRANEPNLYDIPSNLNPTYQPMPLLLQITIAISSALIVGRKSVAAQLVFYQSSNFCYFTNLLSALTAPLPLLQSEHRLVSSSSTALLRKILFFLLRTTLLTTIARLAIQERFYPPSRVTTQYLAERGELPSRLSRYELVTPLELKSRRDVVHVVLPTATTGISTTSSSWEEEEEDDDDDDSHLQQPIGVHSIQYTQGQQPPPNNIHTIDDTTTENNNNNSKKQTITKNKYDGIYLHHGFGASSLSWLPVLPSLVDKIGNDTRINNNNKGAGAVGIAHDAPGFGFTDRPNGDTPQGLWEYSSENNVGIGLALLKKAFSSSEDDCDLDAPAAASNIIASNKEDAKSIAIFGHSMGSKAALQMALHCASHPDLQLKPGLVVLVAPALEGGTMPSRSGGGPSSKSTTTAAASGRPKRRGRIIRRILNKVYITWRKLFLDYPFQYGLRRLVSASPNFWRKGLSLAWGDPTTRLSDSDVLRFAWPSIGKGWEMGLINFTRSKLGSSSLASSNPSRYAGVVDDDVQLLKEVAKLKDVKVVIVYGSKDNVVRIEGSVSERLKEEYPSITLVRMEGMGHDPFEEDVDGFLKALENALE